MARAGAAELEAEADRLFGKRQKGGPRARVMATLPTEAATEPELVSNLVNAGMDCARINCAHDDPEIWGQMVENVRAAAARIERPCRVMMDIAGPKCRILRVKAPPKTRLVRGDRVVLVDELHEKMKEPIAFSLNFPELVDQLAVGAEVFIDDGKAAARVVSKAPGRVEIEVYAAREKGVRLKPGKGVNFPSTELDLPPLTSKDFRDIDFIAEHADLIGYSFVQRVDDIELLQDHLVARAPKREPPGLVLKIETPLAVRNLPPLILQSAAHNPTAVMIARGDLAVELGFARLTEMQEEILWLCEAAHTPVVWATQVLDNFVRDGVASRAEMTDAAMAQGAECVMLNKGAVSRRGRDFPARRARPHGPSPRQEIRPLRPAQGLDVTEGLTAARHRLACSKRALSETGPTFSRRWTKTNSPPGKAVAERAPARYPCLGVVADQRSADDRARAGRIGEGAEGAGERDLVFRNRPENAARQMAGNDALCGSASRSARKAARDRNSARGGGQPHGRSDGMAAPGPVRSSSGRLGASSQRCDRIG